MKKKVAVIGSGLILFMTMALSGTMIGRTTWFCLRCHEISPPDDVSTGLRHNPMNPEAGTCRQCHFRPGFIGILHSQVDMVFSHLMAFDRNFSSTPGKSYPSDSSLPVTCIHEGCHQVEAMDKSDPKDQIVSMSHLRHIQVMKHIGTRSKCLPCHTEIAHGEDSYLPNMKRNCFLCHRNVDIAASNCALCHPAHPQVQLKGKRKTLFGLHKGTEISCTACHIDRCKATRASCETCHLGKKYGDLVVFQGEMLE
ncbi:MAG: hypothetical protein ACMUIA_11890 [bacterium]